MRYPGRLRDGRADRENSLSPGNTKGLSLQQPQKVGVYMSPTPGSSEMASGHISSPSTWVLTLPSSKNGVGSQGRQPTGGWLVALLPIWD